MNTSKPARRRYDALIRFLKETVQNPRMSHRVRMAAAVRLDNIYARHELVTERAENRRERERAREDAAQLKREAVPAQLPEIQPPDETDNVTTFRELLDSIGKTLDESVK